MSIEGFTSFLLNMGHCVRKSGGVHWYNVHPHIYMSYPFHRLVDPHEVSFTKALGIDGLVARYPCNIDIGIPSYRLACNRSEYNLNSLSLKARNQTRRGLEKCTVRPIRFEQLAKAGLQLNRDTLLRQGRTINQKMDDYWLSYYHFANQSNGAESWGAFINDDLAAYSISFRMEDVVNILVVRSATKYLKYYPNNALIYNYVQHVFQKTDAAEVSYGLESIQDSVDALTHFKVGMGFAKVLIGQRLEFCCCLKPFLFNTFLTQAKKIIKFNNNNEKMNKLSGLIDWQLKMQDLKK